MEAKKPSSSSAAIPAEVRAVLFQDEKQDAVLSGEHNKIMRLGRVLCDMSRRKFNRIPLTQQDLERKRLRDLAKQEAHETLSAAARDRSPDPERPDPEAAVSPGYFQVDLALVHAQMPGPSFMRSLTSPCTPKPQALQLSPQERSAPTLNLIGALPNSLPDPAELRRRFTIRERAEQDAEPGGGGGGGAAAASGSRQLLPSRRSIIRSASQALLSIRTAASQAHMSSTTSTSPASLPPSPKASAVQFIPAMSPLSDLVVSVGPKPSTPRTSLQPPPPSSAVPQLPTNSQPSQLTTLLQVTPSSPTRPSDARPAAPLPQPALPDADPPLPQSPSSAPSYPASPAALLSLPPSPLSSPGQQSQPDALSPGSRQAATALRARPHTAGKSLVLLLSTAGSPAPSPPTTPRASTVNGFADDAFTRSSSQQQLRPTPAPIPSPRDVRHGAVTGASPQEHPAAAGAAQQERAAPVRAASISRTLERPVSRGAGRGTSAVQPSALQDSSGVQLDRAPKLLPAVPAPRVLELVFKK